MYKMGVKVMIHVASTRYDQTVTILPAFIVHSANKRGATSYKSVFADEISDKQMKTHLERGRGLTFFEYYD